MTRYIAVGTVSDFASGTEVTGLDADHAQELLDAGIIREATKDDDLAEVEPSKDDELAEAKPSKAAKTDKAEK